MKLIAPLLLTFFPWLMPWNDASKTVTDMSYLNPAPITAMQKIVARDGHFYDQTGKRVRLLGVNLAWSACFPDKKDAPVVAARLQKLGVNLVRFHNMDVGFAPEGIFDSNYPDIRHLDKDQLDRLDYFVAQLKEHGIYIDLNLLVGRKLDAASDQKQQAGLSDKARGSAAYFYPPFMELQKEYARDLLGHYNPYTKSTFAQEPAVALVELLNERTLAGQGGNGVLQAMPAPYAKVLLDGWNDFLKQKYQTTDGLQNAWFGVGASSLLGENVLVNSAFLNNAQSWKQETDLPVLAEVSTVPAEIPNLPGALAYQVKIQNLSTQSWHLQLHQTGLNLLPQTNYTLSFWAKCAAPRDLQVKLQSDQSPWQNIAPPHAFNVDNQWKQFTAIYQVGDTIPNHSGVSFVLGNSRDQVWLANIQLRPGGQPALPEGQSLEQGNIALPLVNKTRAGQDALAYLSSLEVKHLQSMRDYVRNELHVDAPIIGSQPYYGGLSGVFRDSQMDVVDMHSYWAHPALMSGDWGTATVSNKSMVADSKRNLFRLFAAHRVEGKPYTITEFNECPPNEFRAEALPMLASYAAWQDWDALVLFDYNDNRTRWEEPALGGFFRMHNDPAMLTMFPIAANIFLRGDLKPAPTKSVLQIPLKDYPSLAAQYSENGSSPRTLREDLGYGADQLLSSRWSLQFSSSPNLAVAENPPVVADKSTFPVQWKALSAASGLYTVNTPASKIIIGDFDHAPSQPISIPGFQIMPGETQNNFVAATLTALDNQPIQTSSKVLLTLAGNFTNTDFTWNPNYSVQYWGHAPLLAEGVSATIQIATDKSAVTVYALDATGARKNVVPSQLQNHQLSFSVNRKQQTVWYEISGG
jgi:hypothetical protein